jgi:DNA-binding helix-hairpin-helix protein with protein kinase domain
MSHSTSSSDTTNFYKPPSLNKQKASKEEEMSDDLFTLAVTVIFMLYGRHPYPDHFE